MEFEECDTQYRTRFSEMSLTSDGLRFLKLRTLIDIEPLKISTSLRESLCLGTATVKRTQLTEIRKRLYNDRSFTPESLDRLLKTTYSEILNASPVDTSSLKDALRDISENGDQYWSAWNSIYRDDIRQHIQHQFVRTVNIQNYEDLLQKIDSLLNPVVKGYVVISWYNQWSSTLIERLFMSHHNVIPTARRIDKVDFFFSDIPVDLKVTFLPDGYMRDLIKRHLINRVGDAVEFLINNRLDLAKWLYENQGEPRFSDSHRLFLTLVDVNNINNSWKLKSSFELIETKVNEYLDSANTIPMLNWTFRGDKISGDFATHTDVLLITNA